MVFGKRARPSALLFAALLLFFATVIPLFRFEKAAAYGLITSRKVTMSSSANGSTVAGQDVTYEVSFNVATDTSDIRGVVVDFCGNTPIIGDSCTAPTGFDLNITNLAITINAGLTGFTKSTSESDANTLVFTNATAYNPGVAETQRFTLGTAAVSDGVDNPENANTTFYARIITFTTTTGANDYASATTGANNPGAEPPVIDAGGIALSTAAQIIVTAKVQERLLFCVYTTGTGNNCTSKSGTAVTLGDTNGVLDPTGPYVDKNAKFSITTNASGNAVVRMKGVTLTSGANNISPNLTPATSTAGSEQFGLCTYESAGTGLVEHVDYDGGTGTECSSTTQTAGTGATGGAGTADYTFDTNGTDGTTSTYGETIATKPAGDYSTGTLVFLGNISNTTEAGIYTTTLTFIATGTY